MPQLHERGVELVLQLLDAADQLDSMPSDEVRALLRETATVLSELLKRDLPARHEEQPET